MVAIGAVLRAPFSLFRLYASGSDLLPIAVVLDGIAAFFIALPLTVAVSDICISIKPGVLRSYQRTFKNPGRVLGTYLAATLLSIVAFLALIIPGLIVSAFYMFVGPVVILEQLGGRAAFKRSRELGRGYYLRNVGVFLVVLIILLLVLFLVGAIVGLAVGMMGGTEFTVQVVVLPFALCLSPLMAMPLILLYYDMRSRKEDYGAPQLAEDMKY
jgi:hypothetical protein